MSYFWDTMVFKFNRIDIITDSLLRAVLMGLFSCWGEPQHSGLQWAIGMHYIKKSNLQSSDHTCPVVSCRCHEASLLRNVCSLHFYSLPCPMLGGRVCIKSLPNACKTCCNYFQFPGKKHAVKGILLKYIQVNWLPVLLISRIAKPFCPDVSKSGMGKTSGQWLVQPFWDPKLALWAFLEEGTPLPMKPSFDGFPAF